MDDPFLHEVDELVAALRSASGEEVRRIRARLVELASGPRGGLVRDHLERVKREELLEVQWEIEEVLEETVPKRPEAPAPEEPEAPPADEPPAGRDDEMVLVYDDPRGVLIHRTRSGNRWFLTQVDPRTGQPMTYEIPPSEVPRLEEQIRNSPYRVLGN